MRSTGCANRSQGSRIRVTRGGILGGVLSMDVDDFESREGPQNRGPDAAGDRDCLNLCLYKDADGERDGATVDAGKLREQFIAFLDGLRLESGAVRMGYGVLPLTRITATLSGLSTTSTQRVIVNSEGRPLISCGSPTGVL